jgi:hypothetical protein
MSHVNMMAIVMRIVVKSIPYFPSHLVQPSHKSGLILLKLDRYNQPIPEDRHPQYRHYPTVIRAIASSIIIEV